MCSSSSTCSSPDLMHHDSNAYILVVNSKTTICCKPLHASIALTSRCAMDFSLTLQTSNAILKTPMRRTYKSWTDLMRYPTTRHQPMWTPSLKCWRARRKSSNRWKTSVKHSSTTRATMRRISLLKSPLKKTRARYSNSSMPSPLPKTWPTWCAPSEMTKCATTLPRWKSPNSLSSSAKCSTASTSSIRKQPSK